MIRKSTFNNVKKQNSYNQRRNKHKKKNVLNEKFTKVITLLNEQNKKKNK